MWIGEPTPSELADSLMRSRSATLAHIIETVVAREERTSRAGDPSRAIERRLYCAPDPSVTCPKPYSELECERNVCRYP